MHESILLLTFTFSVDADLRTINATITFLPLDREACTLVKISDGNIPDGFMVDVSVDDVDLEVPPVLVTITSDDGKVAMQLNTTPLPTLLNVMYIFSVV